ncbi:gamma-tubulin complex component 4 isoform X3 [Zootermopsis nevadensis]|nr:gamma-tubulin complex component 4 isoform X3 [Zootermopsis nevadensis]
MLHEVLLALSGYSDSFITQVMENDSFLDPNENMLLKRVLNIASGFASIKTFIDDNISVIGVHRTVADDCVKGEIERQPFGVYLQAFCNGLNEVLVPYRKDIADLEEKSLEDPYLPLLTIVSKVEEYTKLFEVINSMIKQISEQHIHGCQILDFLHREVTCSVNNVKEPLKCIIQCCHVVFFKQLSSWLLYGQLIDQYAEFFIQHSSDTQGTSTSTTLDSFSSQDINEMLSLESRSNRDGPLQRYSIQYTMLPSYIIPSLAHKVLFIGETILMFGSEPIERSETVSFTSKNITSIWGEREEEFFQKLQSLQAMRTFNRTEFEKTIDEFRSCVTEHLWKLAVEEAELFLQLKLMKDIFLLGRGELFLEFIHQAGRIMQNPPISSSTRDVNKAFHIAARKILINDDTIDKFSFVLPGKGHTELDEVKGTCWHLLTLTYKVSWPLHLLFDSVVLENYNKLFRFLLYVKKTQLDLHSIWRSQMECKTRCVYESEPAVWHLRSRLMFLVDNLQYYLQVDVLESQYTMLLSAVQATKDFDQIQKAHTLFQANILSQTFLLADKICSGSEMKTNPVQSILTKVLDLCRRFCTSVCMWGNDLNEPQLLELHNMVQEYENLVMYLLQLLSDLSLHLCGSHLSQLLLRLDFNRWFSKEHTVTSFSETV